MVSDIVERLRRFTHGADHPIRICGEAADEIERLRAALEGSQKLVTEQAEDEVLWFVARTAAEDYLQQELRKLHAVIEQKSPEQCARETLEQQEDGE